MSEQEKMIAKKDMELEDTRNQLKDQSDANREWMTSKELLNKELEFKDLEIESLRKAAKTSDTVVQWLNKQLTAAKVRDPGLRIGPPPTNITNFTLSTPKPGKTLVASTPITAKDSDDENKSDNHPVLDPKYLQPSKKKTSSKSLATSKAESVYFS